jgi:hypothetical protein
MLLRTTVFSKSTVSRDFAKGISALSGKYYVEGELAIVNKDTLRELFSSLQPIFKACKRYQCIVQSALPRYLWSLGAAPTSPT